MWHLKKDQNQREEKHQKVRLPFPCRYRSVLSREPKQLWPWALYSHKAQTICTSTQSVHMSALSLTDRSKALSKGFFCRINPPYQDVQEGCTLRRKHLNERRHSPSAAETEFKKRRQTCAGRRVKHATDMRNEERQSAACRCSRQGAPSPHIDQTVRQRSSGTLRVNRFWPQDYPEICWCQPKKTQHWH